MDRSELYLKCCDCKYAIRSKGGNPAGCVIRGGPNLTETTCLSFVLWWTKPPAGRPRWATGLGILASIPVVVWFILKGIVWALKSLAPGVNKDALGLYLPRVSKDFYLPRKRR